MTASTAVAIWAKVCFPSALACTMKSSEMSSAFPRHTARCTVGPRESQGIGTSRKEVKKSPQLGTA